VDQIIISPDQRTVAVSGENREVVAYDLGTGAETARWEASRYGWVNGMAFLPDGTLVTANDDGRIAFWDAETHEPIDEIRVFDEVTDATAYPGGPVRAAISHDGASIAVTIGERGVGSFVAVYDVATGDERWRRATDEDMSIPTWSPDDDSIAVGTWQNGALEMLDAANGRQRLEPVTASAGFVTSVSYTRDGQMIVVSGTDGTVTLWDPETLTQIGAELPHQANQWTDAHVVDGRRIVDVSASGLVSTWDLDPARWADQACRIAARTLTPAEWNLFLPNATYDPACA
jgi:WD40 repeat protein